MYRKDKKRENIVDKKVGKKTIKQGEKVQVIFNVVGTDAVRNNLLGIELNSNKKMLIFLTTLHEVQL